MPFAVRLSGELNTPALRRTFREIVRRHEVLRTRFVERDGIALQETEPDLTFDITEIDLRDLPEGEREAEATRIERDDANQPFNFRHAPLIRVTLVQLKDT